MRIPHALTIVHGKFGGWVVMDGDAYMFGATTLDEVLRFVKDFWEPQEEEPPPPIISGPILPFPPPVGNGGGGSSDPHMSPRQRVVLEHLFRGSPNKVIAHEMGISENTVKMYIRELIQAFKVHNRTQVAVKAVGVLGLEV